MDCPARSGLGHAKPAGVRQSLEANKGPLPGEGVRSDRPERGRGAEGKGGDPRWRWAGRKRKSRRAESLPSEGLLLHAAAA